MRNTISVVFILAMLVAIQVNAAWVNTEPTWDRTNNLELSGDLYVGDDVTVVSDLTVGDDIAVTDDLSVGGDTAVTGTITSANKSVVGSQICVPLVSHQAAVAQNDDWGIEMPFDGVVESVSVSTFSGTVGSAEIRNVTEADTLRVITSVNATPENYAMTAAAASCEFDAGDVIELNIAGTVSSPDGFMAVLWVRSTSALSSE